VSLPALHDALAAHGGTVASLLRDPDGRDLDGRHPDGRSAAEPRPDDPGIGAPQRAAAGPRAVREREEYELLLEMILEGSLLHYGRPRVLATDDRDLALLLGDQLYALGLARLAELGDLDSVGELADLISLLSQAQLAGDIALARAAWDAGATAIGWGSSPEHEAAKALARAGDPAARRALLQSARRDSLQGPGRPPTDRLPDGDEL
jgi:hypothetical protein